MEDMPQIVWSDKRGRWEDMKTGNPVPDSDIPQLQIVADGPIMDPQADLEEREAIVRFLRGRSVAIHNYGAPDDRWQNILITVNEGVARTVEQLASAIERGDHLKDQ